MRLMRLLCCFVVAMFSSSIFAALPAPAGFTKGAKFTVKGYTGNETLSDFPVLVCISNNAPVGFTYVDVQNASAADKNAIDLAFVDMDGNGLPFEIDTWNTSGMSLIWVQLQTMTNGTEFVMCWGSVSSGKVVCNDNPFSNYVGVWHMSEPRGTVADSSGHSLAATPAGTSAESLSLAGIGTVGNGRQCAANAYLSIANAAALDIGASFSISGWFDMSSSQPSGDVRFFSRKIRNQTTSDGWEVIRKGAAIAVRGANGDNIASYTPKQSFAGAGWKHLFIVYNGNTATIYENGVGTDTVASGGTAPADNDKSLSIGSYSGGGSSYFVGSVDECRLLQATPSADWAKAEYDSIADPEFLLADEAESYGEIVDLSVSALASAVAYTNATVTVAVQALGNGATLADISVELSVTDNFAAPIWSKTFSAMEVGPHDFPVGGLEYGTTYFVRGTATNNTNEAISFGPTSFTTYTPGEPLATASVSGRTVSSLSADASVATFGEGSNSCTARLEASTDNFATVAAFAETTRDATGSFSMEVTGLSEFTVYALRLRVTNSWGVETTVGIGTACTLPPSGVAELYVDSLGSGDGSSPESALPTIRAALDIAGPGYTIWVRGGEGRNYEIASAADAISIPATLEGISIRALVEKPLIVVADGYAVSAGGEAVVSNEAFHVTLEGLRFMFGRESLGKFINGQGTVGPSCNLIKTLAPFLTLSVCEFQLVGELPDGVYAKSLDTHLVTCDAVAATNLLVEGCSFINLRKSSRGKDCMLFRVRDNARLSGNVFSNVVSILTGIQIRLGSDICTGPFYFVSNVVYQAGGEGGQALFHAAFQGPRQANVSFNRFVNNDGPARGAIFHKSREGYNNGLVFHHNTVVGFNEFINAEGLTYPSVLLASIFDNIFVLAAGTTNIVENSDGKISAGNLTSPTMFKSGSFYRNNMLLTGAFNGGTAADLQYDDWSYDITAGLAIADTFAIGGTTVPAGGTIPVQMPEFICTNDIYSVDFYRCKSVRGENDLGRLGWTGENGEYPRYIGALPPYYPGGFSLKIR